MIQCYFLLKLMCHITGFKQGNVYHKIVNFHLYENQYSLFEEQMERDPFEPITEMFINPEIKTLDDVINKMTVDDVSISEYKHLPAIKYPFTE